MLDAHRIRSAAHVPFSGDESLHTTCTSGKRGGVGRQKGATGCRQRGASPSSRAYEISIGGHEQGPCAAGQVLSRVKHLPRKEGGAGLVCGNQRCGHEPLEHDERGRRKGC